MVSDAVCACPQALTVSADGAPSSENVACLVRPPDDTVTTAFNSEWRVRRSKKLSVAWGFNTSMSTTQS